jgi:hypothetical protein
VRCPAGERARQRSGADLGPTGSSAIWRASVTHADECTSLGGLLAALMESAVPVAYTVCGKSLARRLCSARPGRTRPVELARESTAGGMGLRADGRVPARHMEAIPTSGSDDRTAAARDSGPAGRRSAASRSLPSPAARAGWASRDKSMWWSALPPPDA